MVDSIEELSIEHGQVLGTAEVTSWKFTIDDGENRFASFTSKLMAKAGNQSQSLDSTRPANASIPQPGTTTFDSNSSAIKAAKADIEVDADIISNEGKDLAEEVNFIDDWSEATDDQVEEYVQKIDKWKERLSKIKERGWAIKRNVKKHDLDETQLTASMALIVTLESEMSMAIDGIMFEDGTRGIVTLSKSKSANVVLPTFSGKPEEDFSKFQREMLKGFKANRIKREDQVKKLRENLKGHPLSLVPDTMDNIDNAWENLSDIYGDAARVMKSKMNKLKTMGLMPKNGQTFAALKNQVEWLTNLEITLKEILEVGGQSLDMDRQAFNPETVKDVKKMFPFYLQRDLYNLGASDGKDAIRKIIDYIIDLRKERQGMMKDADVVAGSHSVV